jgi:replicative DNA helicase
MTTSELFALPVRLTLYRMNVIAFVAHLTGVPRLDKQNLDAMLYSFVNQKLTQLKERPAITKSALFLRAWLLICTLPNPCQIF